MWSNLAKSCSVNFWRNPGENISSVFLLFIRSQPFKYAHKLILLLYFFAISVERGTYAKLFLFFCVLLHSIVICMLIQCLSPISLCISPSHFEGIPSVLSSLKNILVWGRHFSLPLQMSRPFAASFALLLLPFDVASWTRQVTVITLAVNYSNAFWAD